MKITREFRLSTWDTHTASAVVEYLTSRGFRDAQLHSEGPRVAVVGSRGSWIGNFTSFDMRKLRSRVKVSGDASGHVSVDLNVNTFGQHVTEWNRAFWRLELIELRAVAADGSLIAEVWERYAGPRRRAATLWALSGAIFGRRMPAAWAVELEQFERSFTAKGPA